MACHADCVGHGREIRLGPYETPQVLSHEVVVGNIDSHVLGEESHRFLRYTCGTQGGHVPRAGLSWHVLKEIEVAQIPDGVVVLDLVEGECSERDRRRQW